MKTLITFNQGSLTPAVHDSVQSRLVCPRWYL